MGSKSGYIRKRRTLRLPITLSVIMMTLNVALMVCWIILLAQRGSWSALTIGTIMFALIFVGMMFYMFLTVKEVRLNQRQSNFVDSVTHELKTPIAALKLYLETLQLRELNDEQRADFYQTMEHELQRLDHLISQLLEVGRLDAIGHQSDPEDIPLDRLLRRCAVSACAHHKQDPEQVVSFDVEPIIVHSRPVVLEMIFGNLLDNAVKYAGDPPQVEVNVRMKGSDRVSVRITDNGEGVPSDLRKKVFQMFYRGGDELEDVLPWRRRTGASSERDRTGAVHQSDSGSHFERQHFRSRQSGRFGKRV